EKNVVLADEIKTLGLPCPKRLPSYVIAMQLGPLFTG
ncbi:unnamed protein product, partial [marine sediment metagenome]